MKFLLIGFIFASLSAYADVTGTWAYSGSGCRNESLSPESHRSKAPSGGRIDEAIFTFESDGTAKMDAILDGEKVTQRGTYSLNGDSLVIHNWGDSVIKVVGDRIVIYSEKDSENSSCRSGEVFVYILAKVN